MTHQPPCSESAERSVIGAVLVNPVAYLNVTEFLKPEDFFFLRHSYIWQAIGKLESRRTAIDTVTLSQELQDMGVLAEIGGPAYLTALIRDVPTSVHAEIYGHMVERTSLRRQLLQVADEIKLLAVDTTLPTEQVFERAESGLLEITGYGIEKEPTDIFTITNNMLDDIERLRELKKQGITPGLPTGYPDWDVITGGSHKKELLIIAGPAKSGKSTISLNVARNRLVAGARGIIFSTEMSKEAIARKFAVMETGIPASVIKNMTFHPAQYSRFVEATRKISKWKLDVIDQYPRLTPVDIRRELRNLIHQHQVDFVLIDGLWMMNAEAGIKFEKRTYEIAYIMKKLVAIAREFNVRLDIVHQCSRSADNRRDKRPINSDLADSVDVERNADTIIFLYRESFYVRDGSDKLEVIVKSTREGETGEAHLTFDKRSESYLTMTSEPVVLASPLPKQRKLVNVEIDDERKDVYQ